MSAQIERLEVKVAQDGIIVRFKRPQNLREDNVPSVAAELVRIANAIDGRTLTIDFGRVTFLTANVLGKLITLHKQLRARDGRLRLINVTPPIYELFKITRLHTYMDINSQ